MTDNALTISANDFKPMTFSLDGRTLRIRALLNHPYCARPLDPIQRINIYAPEEYFVGGSVSGYTSHTAPVFVPSTVGGYLPGPAATPGPGRFSATNSVFEALAHGYVVAGIGVRGRTSGEASSEFFEGSTTESATTATGRLVGRAPAFIVDLKAGIRFLRHNREAIPGSLERIVTNGTSAGGAHSALAGTSGDVDLYDSELERIDAIMDESDAVFAASCYCPIHNLEHADAAYEWQFRGIADCHFTHFRKRDGKVVKLSDDSVLTPRQMAISEELADAFPAYVNSLGLTDESGAALTLAQDGTGAFLDYLTGLLCASAQRELDTRDSETRLAALMTEGANVDRQSCLSIENGQVTGLDWPAFVRSITRMKPCPAFDGLDLGTPENQEFGDERVYARHFTAFSQEHSTVDAELADPKIVRMMNPLSFVDSPGCAQHFRIRHGSHDRDTSLSIPAILALKLMDAGKDVDFALPWGLPHSGDYDLADLFAWIDRLCLQ
ncbi:MAG: subtype B tannase [Tractidigestivibacter sp.]|jgi:acetyl esterase/lipase|uniref:subtype B tannase n=1 Tax=Tractidigestivibacter sp. TaxID=2847320 RepID=UPI003D8A1B11